MPYVLTDSQRNRYRETSIRSSQRKLLLLKGGLADAMLEPPLVGRLDPNDLMPQLDENGLSCLSLFSGGGGLDIGFERAGFSHRAAFEILDICGETLSANRPHWHVRSGKDDGDVVNISFAPFRGVDIVHSVIGDRPRINQKLPAPLAVTAQMPWKRPPNEHFHWLRMMKPNCQRHP